MYAYAVEPVPSASHGEYPTRGLPPRSPLVRTPATPAVSSSFFEHQFVHVADAQHCEPGLPFSEPAPKLSSCAQKHPEPVFCAFCVPMFGCPK